MHGVERVSRDIGLSPYEIDYLKTFVRHGVLFMVIGGTAIRLHGYTYRDRHDMDVVVDPSLENQIRRTNAAAELRERHGKQTPWGDNWVDLMGGLHGVPLEEAFRDQVTIECEAGNVPVIALHHIIANKRYMWRPKDMTDLAALTICPIEGETCTRCEARVTPHPHLMGWLPPTVDLRCDDAIRPTSDLAMRPRVSHRA